MCIFRIREAPQPGSTQTTTHPFTLGSSASEAETLYQALFEASPVATLLLGRDRVLITANRAARELLGLEPSEVASLSLPSLIADPDEQRHFEAVVEQLFAGERLRDPHALTIHRHDDGAPRRLHATLTPFPVAERVAGVIVQLRDLARARSARGHDTASPAHRDDATARLEAERALAIGEARLSLAQQLAHVGSWSRDLDGSDNYWSDEMFRLFGHEPGTVAAAPRLYRDHIHPDDAASFEAAMIPFRDELEDSYDIRARFLGADGIERVLHVHGERVRGADGAPVRLDGTAQDVTALVRAEADLRRLNDQLATRSDEQRDLVRQLFTAQEEERRIVAYDFHDGPIQQLTAAELFIAAAEGETDTAVRDIYLARARVSLTHGIAELRRIVSGLRPAFLDEVGLVGALRTLLTDLVEDLGIEFHFDADPAIDDLPRIVEITVYRVVQEAVSNALRHSNTPRLDVRLHRTPEAVTAEIQDYGVGFDTARLPAPGPGRRLGLIAMRERITPLGGDFHIDSSRGNGTLVSASIPLPVVTTQGVR